MAGRRHPNLVPSRYTDAEHALIQAAARVQGKNLQEFVRGIVLPVVFATLEQARDQLSEHGG